MEVENYRIPKELVLEGPNSTSMIMGGIAASKIIESIWIGQQRLGASFKAAAYGIFFRWWMTKLCSKTATNFQLKVNWWIGAPWFGIGSAYLQVVMILSRGEFWKMGLKEWGPMHHQLSRTFIAVCKRYGYGLYKGISTPKTTL